MATLIQVQQTLADINGFVLGLPLTERGEQILRDAIYHMNMRCCDINGMSRPNKFWDERDGKRKAIELVEDLIATCRE
jgi:hypothetical protein